MFGRLVVGLADSAPVTRLITGTVAGRALAHRFVAGDTLDQAIAAAKALNREGLLVSLDLLGEVVTEPAAVEAAMAGYEACLSRIAQDRVAGNISIKLTQLGLAFDKSLAATGLDRLARLANTNDLTVTIDMEDSRFTDATVALYEDAQRVHHNLGVALQAYLFRSPDDVQRLASLGGHIRLCKGAYVEPADVAYTARHDVDAAFARLLELLMPDPVVRPAIATHDERLIDLTRQLATHRQGAFEFQMLYGVRPALQKQLVAAGHKVRVYVPYGSAWYPYLVRRLAERPANLGFFLRALVSR
jgi:proline dehydrogenase